MKKKYYLLILMLSKICIVSSIHNQGFKDIKSSLMQRPFTLSDKQCSDFKTESDRRQLIQQQKQEDSEHNVKELLELYHNLNATDEKGYSLLPPEIKEYLWTFVNGNALAYNAHTIKGNEGRTNLKPEIMHVLCDGFPSPSSHALKYAVSQADKKDKNEIREAIKTKVIKTDRLLTNLKSFRCLNNNGDIFISYNNKISYFNVKTNILKEVDATNFSNFYILHNQQPTAIAYHKTHAGPFGQNATIDVYLYQYKQSAIKTKLLTSIELIGYLDIYCIQFGRNETIWIDKKQFAKDTTNITQYAYKGNLLATLAVPIPKNYVFTNYQLNLKSNLFLVTTSFRGKLEIYQHLLVDDKGNFLTTITNMPNCLDLYKSSYNSLAYLDPAPLILKVQPSQPSEQKVNADLNGTLLIGAAKKLLEQPKPNTKQRHEVIKALKSNPQKRLIIYTAQQIYKENIFKKLYNYQTEIT